VGNNDIDIKVISGGIQEMLRSREVAANLDARARRVEDAAGPGHKHETTIGSERARATVWAVTHEARRAEATDRVLTRAIDAARG
jgi:hypothetical protein